MNNGNNGNPQLTEEEKILAFAREKGIDPEVVRQQLHALRSQTYNEDVMYYSRVRFAGLVSTVVGPPLVSTITINPIVLYAFGYAVAGQVQQGGFPALGAGPNATQADTNLVKASETNGGERVIIKGISVRLGADSDPLLWGLITNKLSFQVRMANKDRYLIGSGGDIPQLNALPYGVTRWLQPPTDSPGPANTIPPQNQVMLYATGYMPFTRPIIWAPAGETDSNLTVACQLHEAITFTQEEYTPDPELCPCGRKYSPPKGNGETGTFVDLWVRLHGTLSAGRSPNE